MEKEFTIFDPRKISGSYFNTYPELKRIPEFENLKENEIKLVWYYANPTSPYAEITDDKDRMKKSCSEVFKLNPDNRIPYLKGDIPSNVSMAISRMARMLPTHRNRAKEIIEKTFSELEGVAKLGIEGFRTSTGDIDYSKYVTTMASVRKELPELLKILEEGFSVKMKNDKQKTELDGQAMTKEFMNQQKEEIK